jgi:hypothetical protein
LTSDSIKHHVSLSEIRENDDKVQLKVRIRRKTDDAWRQFLSYIWVKYGQGTISEMTEQAIIEFMQRRIRNDSY